MQETSNAGGILIFGGFVGLAIAAMVFIFWLWMLIDCLANEKDTTLRIVWALVIFFLPFLGSLIYLFARKMPRAKIP